MKENLRPGLDKAEKLKGHLFLKEVILQTSFYLAAAMQYANHEAGLSDEEFWRGLFCLSSHTQKEVVLSARDGNKPEECPPYPYEKLDFQACNKYLLFGGERMLPQGGFATDSLNFYETFRVPYFKRPNGSAFPKEPYQGVLRRAIDLRNKKSHDSPETIEQVTRQSIEDGLNTLRQLTAPIQRKAGWVPGWRTPLAPLAEYWKQVEARKQELFGCAPISLEELGRELFLTEGSLSPEQRKALEEAAVFLRLSCSDGQVYEEEYQALKTKLTCSPSVARLLGSKAAASQEEAEERARRRSASRQESRSPKGGAPRLLRSRAGAAEEALLRAGTLLQLKGRTLPALLDCFTPLVDESLFLSPEGQRLLNQELAPLLIQRGEKLLVDESVVTELFRLFRGSVPYTDLELADLDPEQAQDLIAQRRELHSSSKNAIKVLRLLRQRKCLEVVFSPTDSPRPYENIRQVAESYSGNRFLALTMDRQLAEELKALPNAAAAKPCLDGQLLIYRDTKANYQALLEGPPPAAEPPKAEPAEAPAPKSPSAPKGNPDFRGSPAPRPAAPPPQAGTVFTHSVETKTLLPMGELPKTGARVLAEWPGGQRKELVLGAQAGSAGGEGTVYNVARQPQVVAKIYHRDQLTEERRKKLQYMTASDPHIQGLCWPQAMLFNQENQWAGYLMPKAEAAELCRTVYKPGRNNRNITALGWSRKSLALIAANMAGIFARMHARKILMGDVNPRNFLVAPDCSVFFVDCDSYQFGEFPCPVRSDRYTPPEVLKEVRRSGRESYNYLRTPDHERYSMAVVLFEILMLGKSPYESRSTDSDNVLDAIAAGNFPYPFRTGEEGEEVYTDQAPVGRWREIWSHMTYQIKSGFYSTFTGKGRLSAGEWERLLREYIRQIELGHSSDELTPEGFKDLDGSLLDKVCSECGKPYKIDEKTYSRRKEREPDLCPTHRTMYQNFRERKLPISCASCGKPFEVLVATWRDRTRRGLPMYCPGCVNVQLPCSRCGTPYSISRERADELKAKGIDFLCSECLEYERPRVTCEGPDCQETFRTSREKLEQLRRKGRPILCSKCLRAMLNARN